MRGLKVGIVGAKGLVGQKFIEILDNQKDIPIAELRPFGTRQTVGRKVRLKGRQWRIVSVNTENLAGLDLVFFSGAEESSAQWAPVAVEKGAWVVDNSSFFRLDPQVPLVIPEINGHLLDNLVQPQIIANPNCTTTAFVMLLAAVFRFKPVLAVVVSFQSASGAGRDALAEFVSHSKMRQVPLKSFVFPVSLAYNVIAQIGAFDDFGITQEESKIIHETAKILGSQLNLTILPTCVRVPVQVGHSLSVWLKFGETKLSFDHIKSAIKDFPGIILIENPTQIEGLTPRECAGQTHVVVGRIHQVPGADDWWHFWVVEDNLLKGAAFNSWQILERLWKSGKIHPRS